MQIKNITQIVANALEGFVTNLPPPIFPQCFQKAPSPGCQSKGLFSSVQIKKRKLPELLKSSFNCARVCPNTSSTDIGISVLVILS